MKKIMAVMSGALYALLVSTSKGFFHLTCLNICSETQKRMYYFYFLNISGAHSWLSATDTFD